MKYAVLIAMLLLPATLHAVGDVTIANKWISLAISPGNKSTPFPHISSLVLYQDIILNDASLPPSTNLITDDPTPLTQLNSHWATKGTIVHASATELRVSGLEVADATGSAVATETWTITLDGPSLRINTERTFLTEVKVVTDRFPAIVLQTTRVTYDNAEGSGSDWRKMPQIFSWVALDGLLDRRRHLAHVVDGTLNATAVTWAGLLSDSAGSQGARMLLSPSGIEMNASVSECRFAVIRPAAGIVPRVGLGGECGAGGGGYHATAGSATSNTLTLQFGKAHDGHGKFRFNGPAAIAAVASTFTLTMNMFMGWINGNSPASVSCLHELSLFSQLQGMFGVDGVGGAPSVHEANRIQFDFILGNTETSGVNQSGWLDARWSIVGQNWPDQGPQGGGYWPPTPSMGITDQMPHTVLGVYYYAVNTGDFHSIKKWMPALDRMMHFMLKEMKLSPDAGGVLANPLCDGVSNHSCAGNWLDDIRFGHYDGIVAAYAVRAVQVFAELKNATGDAKEAAMYQAIALKVKEAYNEKFWSDTLGYYVDWEDAVGKKHAYWYAWTQYIAIIFGIASKEQTASIMKTRGRLYEDLVDTFNVTHADLFCQPANMIPVHVSDITLDFDDEYVYPHYENGECFFWHSGMELLALGASGGADAVFERFSMAVPHYQSTRFWGQRFRWLTQEVLGMDVISDSLHYLYGFLLGGFNVRPSLNGVEIVGAPAKALEGASWTFAHLGRDTTVTVVNGKQAIST